MTEAKIVTFELPYPDRGNREIQVYVPAHEEGETFPVIYMTDGQNLFEPEKAAFGCWNIPQTMEEERAVSGKAAIVVGIKTVDPWRPAEMTPLQIGEVQCPDEVRPFVKQEGEIFDEFVLNTLRPAVEERFPVKTGREHTAFCGSSAGGLMSFFAAMNHPDVYCAAGVFSPAFLIYRPEDLKQWILSKLRDDMPYLYFYCGGQSETEQQILPFMEMIYDFMTECYPATQLNEVILLEQTHHESAWGEIFKDFLHTFLS